MGVETATVTISEFLLARIAEDERLWGNPAFAPVAGVGLSKLVLKMRAECEAKRRIVEEHPIYRGPRILAVDTSGTDYGCETCHCIDPIKADGIIEGIGYCSTLLALATVYADHPDYRDEWRP